NARDVQLPQAHFQIGVGDEHHESSVIDIGRDYLHSFEQVIRCSSRLPHIQILLLFHEHYEQSGEYLSSCSSDSRESRSHQY
ncbi:hypothetical protein PMAYCL1PPCAC_00989, partial [Pristionchus mayeri]